eukprot:TRINITY_DN4720_c0_g1_i1.p1 TRINITY_DN4720_c0_g1~~TRINITY_DN4720_c0_g1_i1.p1  ORF type:complete len:288 (+),score=62.24 TRINITY_DN4720_c0_g1_i1:119-982(+)
MEPKMSTTFTTLKEIGSGFFNIRGHFKIALGLVDLQTQMSLLRLSNGNFLVIDTIELTETIKKEIDQLTDNGKKIEAVVATHPFHTLAFPNFHKAYPNPPYYGTPRHVRRIKEITWAGDLSDCNVRSKWKPDVDIRIPDGTEFVNPLPEKSNHFCGAFVFHKESKTIHNDDTVMYAEDPSFLLRVAGFKKGSMCFHVSMKGPGLLPTPDAPFLFRDFINNVIRDWDFDNFCTAHFGCKVGGAKAQLIQTNKEYEKTYASLAEKKKNSNYSYQKDIPTYNVGNSEECG